MSQRRGDDEPGRPVNAKAVPDNYLFTAEDNDRARALNLMCASLVRPESREAFLRDEAAYCDSYDLTEDQKAAVLARDWAGMLDLGGSIFFVYKLAVVCGVSMQDLGGIFTGMSTEEFKDALKAGGRSFG
jgi:protocatechuate 4,5-dioxygenase alpha chain